MKTPILNIDQLCKDSGSKTPEEILIPLSNGIDPRRTSQIYRRLQEIEDEFGDDPPDEWSWLELVELIKFEYCYAPVSVSESAAAAKTLMEYKHPKRKSVEKIDLTPTAAETELTKSQIRKLRKAFDLDF